MHLGSKPYDLQIDWGVASVQIFEVQMLLDF